MEAPLSELVKRTEGLQPWRRLFHATNGTVLVVLLRWFPIPTPIVLLALGVLLAVLALADVIRLTRPELNLVFFRWFSHLASPREAAGFASSTWYVLGALLTLWIFPRDVALAGILTLALADPVASLVGRRWGRRRWGGGTVEGSLAFVLVAVGALSLFVPLHLALAGAVAAALVEVLPWGVDDNLSVPLAAAGILTLLA